MCACGWVCQCAVVHETSGKLWLARPRCDDAGSVDLVSVRTDANKIKLYKCKQIKQGHNKETFSDFFFLGGRMEMGRDDEAYMDEKFKMHRCCYCRLPSWRLRI